MRIALGVLLIVSTLGAAGCGKSADERAARRSVTKLYAALKRHDAATACRLVSPAVAEEMLEPTHQAGRPCLPGLRRVFSLVERSGYPGFFDRTPKVGAATVTTNRASVPVTYGSQTHIAALTRTDRGWVITKSPGFR